MYIISVPLGEILSPNEMPPLVGNTCLFCVPLKTLILMAVQSSSQILIFLTFGELKNILDNKKIKVNNLIFV